MKSISHFVITNGTKREDPAVCTILTTNYRDPTAMNVGYDHVGVNGVMNLHWLILH